MVWQWPEISKSALLCHLRYLSYYIDKPMPRVFVMIARPSFLGSWQPDYDTGLQLVGARPKPGLLLGSVSY